MSVLELFAYLEANAIYVIIYTASLPVLTLLLRLLHGNFRAALAPWKYLYSLVIYLACIPGIFVLFSGLYLAGFQGENVLNLNLVVYVLPVLSMIITLILIRRTVRFDDIPGFSRIGGLVAVTVATFVLLLVLDRLRIFLFFRASIIWFLVLGFGIFAALKLGGRAIFGPRR